MSESSYPTENSMAADPTDEIAALLMGESEGEEVKDPTQTDQTLEAEDPDDPEDTDGEAEESTEEVDEVETSDEETEEVDYSEALSEAFGVDQEQILVEEDGSLSIKLKVDGEVSTQPLKELIRGVQSEKSITKRSMALAEDQKSFERYAKEQQTLYKESLEQGAALTEMLEQELMSDYQALNWEELRQYDPAEYAAKRSDFGARYQKLTRVKDELKVKGQEDADTQTRDRTVKQQEHLRGEYQKVVGNNPTWTDPKLYEAGMNDLKSFGSEVYGFSPQEFNNVSDSRLIELLKDAKAYRDGSKVTKKKVLKVPKLQKSKGVRKSRKVSKLDRLTKAAQKASGANRRTLQTDAVAELLAGG